DGDRAGGARSAGARGWPHERAADRIRGERDQDRRMRQDDLTAVEAREAIRPAHSRRDVESARALFVADATWIKVDLCFQDFERKLARLRGAYAPPLGRLLLAGGPDAAFGCIALRPLASGCRCGSTGAEWAGSGEVKRLYVQPARRGEGWGERLAR